VGAEIGAERAENREFCPKQLVHTAVYRVGLCVALLAVIMPRIFSRPSRMPHAAKLAKSLFQHRPTLHSLAVYLAISIVIMQRLMRHVSVTNRRRKSIRGLCVA